MKLSELIARLAEMLEEHGDIVVYVSSTNEYDLSSIVRYDPRIGDIAESVIIE